MLRALILLVLSALLAAPAAAQVAAKPGHYLFVWAQDQDKKGKDFLTVIDADPASPGYG